VKHLCGSSDSSANRAAHRALDPSQTVLAYLCNRTEQDRQLRDAWQLHYSSFQRRRRPFVCVVQGSVLEDHIGYIRRLTSYSVPQAIGLGPDCEIGRPIRVKWPENSADRNAVASALLGNLAAELACSPEPAEILARLCEFGEAFVVYCELSPNMMSSAQQSTIEGFFDLWARWPDLQCRQKMIVVLSVQYSFNSPAWFPKYQEEIVAHAANEGRVSVVVLNELPSVSSQHVKDWIRLPAIERFCDVERNAAAWEAEIDNVFGDRGQIPMEQLVGTLNRMLNMYQRRAL
jgi:inactive STAND